MRDKTSDHKMVTPIEEEVNASLAYPEENIKMYCFSVQLEPDSAYGKLCGRKLCLTNLPPLPYGHQNRVSPAKYCQRIIWHSDHPSPDHNVIIS